MSGSSAQRAAAALARIDSLGFELERVAQAVTERPARPPREVFAWLDRCLAELSFQIRELERSVSLRSREHPEPTELDPADDGGLSKRLANQRPDEVARGVAGFFADYFRWCGVRDEVHFVADPFGDDRALPGLFSHRLGQVYAGLEPVRATFDVLGEIATADGAGAAPRLDALLVSAARRVRYRLAGNIAHCGVLVRRSLEALRADEENR